MIFRISDAWRAAFPEASVGVLAMRGAANPDRCAALKERKEALEAELRNTHAGQDPKDLKALDRIESYTKHYKRFGKSYHVLLQLESVALKGKSIPNVAALVEAMFMAELKNLLLTAGHDLTAVRPPLTLNVTTGTERYVRINGQEQQLKAGDMAISDALAVISDVIYGPDQRTQIAPTTTDVLFTTYAPAGIDADAVQHHLEDIRDNVLLIAPRAKTELLAVYRASDGS